MERRKVKDLIEILSPLSPSKRIVKIFQRIYGEDISFIQENLKWYQEVLKKFAEIYDGNREVFIVRSPGRVNVMGMHIDHQGGSINPIAYREILIVVEPRNDKKVVACNFDERYPRGRFTVTTELPREKIKNWEEWTRKKLAQQKYKRGSWINYLKAPLLYLQNLNREVELKGMNMLVAGNVPPGAGLSSSSALVVATALAAVNINKLSFTRRELVDICGEAEWYVGTRGGQGDHAAILFGRRGEILHIDFFPLKVKSYPLPDEYKLVLCQSFKQSKKSEGSRDIFNQKVATYKIGFMLIKKRCLHLRSSLKYLRDVNPRVLEGGEKEVYKILRELPEVTSREKVLEELPEEREELLKIFANHCQPKKYGYKIRQTILYGIAECERSRLFGEMLEEQNFEKLGELINISHEGDRILRNNRVTNRRLDKLIKYLQEKDPVKREKSRLYQQPGGYEVSCKELDELVDLARSVKGVLGAGLVGAGLGGSIVVLVKKKSVPPLFETMRRKYYEPKRLPCGVEVCRPIKGAEILKL